MTAAAAVWPGFGFASLEEEVEEEDAECEEEDPREYTGECDRYEEEIMGTTGQ